MVSSVPTNNHTAGIGHLGKVSPTFPAKLFQ